MELKIKEVTLPEKIDFNYEELKQELIEKCKTYETIVYTDENIKEAKSDRANLNKLKKALNDERIRREKEYMVPFNTFKAQINEIIGIIDKPVALIDSQVKAFEEKQKQDKRAAIEELFVSIGFQSFVKLDMIFNDKWLNTSTSLKSIEDEMKQMMSKFGNDIFTLNSLPEFAFEAIEVYKSTLDINKAISEAQKMTQIAKDKAEREAEIERKKAEKEAKRKFEEEQNANAGSEVSAVEVACGSIPYEAAFEDNQKAPERLWIAFQAYMTVDDAIALKQFFNDKNIEFKSI